MIVSRYLSEPGLQDTPPLPSGSDPRRRLSPFVAAREPFDRLKFWKVHPLVYRLKPYQATGVSFLRRCSWNTLVFWMQLTDTPSWPDPEAPKAKRYVPEYEMAYAKPFSD